MPASYRREIVEVKDIKGPRGGVILLVTLTCGHKVWFRGRRHPPLTTDCITCYLTDIGELS